MTSADFTTAQLALRAWHDGKTEGLNGMLAVCFSFRNRIRKGWWNGNWAAALAHHREVSYKLEPDPDELPDPGKDYAFFLLLQQIDDIFSGRTEDTITVSQDSLPPPLSPQYVAPVALYWARLNEVTNPWFLENISRSPDHKLVAQVGALSFFS